LNINLKSLDPKANACFTEINFPLQVLYKLNNRIFEGLLVITKLLIENKIDGYAIALQSKNGKLEKSINTINRDVTNKIIKIQNIPKQLVVQGIFQVRGKLYTPIRTSNFS
tara:strand:+ start:494 stop:826 length:333 start_codon:yes stop_codon:yes gene_type:complete